MIKQKSIKNLVREEVANIAAQNEFEEDGEFIPGGIGIAGLDESPSKTKYRQEKRIIDELLASVPQGQGFYLKLSKEIRPNQYELKMRIDNWEQWSDLEWEVARIVQDMSVKNLRSWGSGCYRVLVFRDGGMRGTDYKPYDFYIDANVPDTDGSNNGNGNGSGIDARGITDIINTIRDANPTLSPAEMQKMLADTFNNGMAMAEKNKQNESSNSNMMMTLMMTLMKDLLVASKTNIPIAPIVDPITQMAGMLTMFKSLGMLKEEQVQPAQKSYAEMIRELRDLGLYKDQTPEKDPLERITEMKNLMSAFGDIMGVKEGKSPGFGELIAPYIPKVLETATGAIQSIADVKKAEYEYKTSLMKNQNNAPQSKVRRIASQHVNENQQVDSDPFIAKANELASIDNQEPIKPIEIPTIRSGGQDSMGIIGIKMFLNKTKGAIDNNNYDFFYDLREFIVETYGFDKFKQLVAGEVKLDNILSQIKLLVGDMFSGHQSVDYFNRFLAWAIKQKKNEVVATCKCGEEIVFDNIEDYNNESICQECGAKMQVMQVTS